jgi:hypothetical protein
MDIDGFIGSRSVRIKWLCPFFQAAHDQGCYSCCYWYSVSTHPEDQCFERVHLSLDILMGLKTPIDQESSKKETTRIITGISMERDVATQINTSEILVEENKLGNIPKLCASDFRVQQPGRKFVGLY